ncbi:MAG TPA: hypothetical protein VN922_01415, partial [Bacteroidia bacterium]|nr:hypothetical protein [Bacteroidia bacterium]
TGAIITKLGIENIEDFLTTHLNNILSKLKAALRNDYDYLTSDEAIIETIKANEYQFTKDGKLD